MKTTPQETIEEKIRNGRYEETGIYHVDGAEYNVNEDKLVSFIKSEIEKARQEEKIEKWRIEKIFKDRILSVGNGNCTFIGTPDEILQEIYTLLKI